MADTLDPHDPLRPARQGEGVPRCPFQVETLPVILRHADVREAARDWPTFSSDAPFRVPIPSEEAVRTMRQIPIETNPHYDPDGTRVEVMEPQTYDRKVRPPSPAPPPVAEKAPGRR